MRPQSEVSQYEMTTDELSLGSPYGKGAGTCTELLPLCPLNPGWDQRTVAPTPLELRNSVAIEVVVSLSEMASSLNHRKLAFPFWFY